MRPDDTHLHVRGESAFVGDLVLPAGTLHAAVLPSPLAHGRISSLDTAAAAAAEGVVRVLTARDIPGENQIGTIFADEPLLADATVHHVGQPVAVVLATTAAAARAACAKIALVVDALPAVFAAREAAARGQLLQPARTFASGDVDAAWPRCAAVVLGRVETGAQEHWYLETQSALAEPREDGTVRICASTQSPTGVQRQAARVLGVPMHAVEVDVRRLGGGFGGKEEQATPWAVICALGASLTGRAVRLVLDRRDDLQWTGKRHPYSADYTIGIDGDGTILAYEVVYYQNAGSAADLSTSILERSLFHATGSYAVANVRATAMSCRTNLPPFTAMRGFGAPQAMLVMEAAIVAAARAIDLPAHVVQRRNLLADGDVLPYGLAVEGCRAARCWEEADRRWGIAQAIAAAADHNRQHAATKRGVAAMPVCFGISFTNTTLNQAGALVHVHGDGSVAVSTGAVEMGQGVNRKLRRIAALALGVDPARVRLDTTSTARVANTSPTAASTGADLNGAAVLLACRQLVGRLRGVAAAELAVMPDQITLADDVVQCGGKPTALRWPDVVRAAWRARVDLTAHAHYATPDLAYDRTREQGRPFAYHVYGTAIAEVTLDVLRGQCTVDAVRIVHDAGRSLDPAIDRGQVEGALAQGLGWLLLEEIGYDARGRLRQDTAAKCKLPDVHFAPRTIELAFLDDADNDRAVLGAKAVGEPPFLYGIAAFAALREALRAAGAVGGGTVVAPLTPERILEQLMHREQLPAGVPGDGDASSRQGGQP